MRAAWRVRPVVLSKPKLSGNRVEVRIDPGSAAKYLRPGKLRATYGDGLDVSAVPPGVLVLPALGTVLTVAIAAGVPVEVDEVDADFATGVDAMSVLWRQLYPRFKPGFELRGERVSTQPVGGEGQLLLWSGGLDSTASLIEHRATVRALLTVWGADVQLQDAPLWHALTACFDANPLTDGIARVTVRSNMRRFPIMHTLVHDFLQPSQSWWGRVQHGLALAGLAAPVSVALGTGTLLRAASFSPDSNQATGSMPELDELTRWSGVRVLHDGFELTRQQKIDDRLAPYLAGGGRALLAVCYKRGRHDPGRGLNCGECEKCLRTAAGLLAAGIQPAAVGIDVPAAAYDAWTAKLTSGLKLSHHTLPFWQEAKDALLAADPVVADPAAARFVTALTPDGSLQLIGRRPGRYRYLHGYWTMRRNVRLKEARIAVRSAVRTTRKRAAALVR